MALAASVQGWFMGPANVPSRLLLLAGSMCMIASNWKTDLAGIGIAVVLFALVRRQGRVGANVM